MQYAKNDLGYLVRQHNELVNKIQKIHPEIEQLSKRIGLKPDDDFWKMYLNLLVQQSKVASLGFKKSSLISVNEPD